MKESVFTETAPEAIGPYSQAVKIGNTLYLSGQIPLDPVSMKLIEGDIAEQAEQVIENLRQVCRAAGGSLNDIVKLTIYLVDLANFNQVNEVMVRMFRKPYPARATIQVAALPKGAEIEMDAICVFS